MEMLKYLVDETSGYYGKIFEWLNRFVKDGVQEGEFTEKQVRRALQIALWYSFACNNLDDYIYSCRAAEWMKDSEKKATRCGTWYYRYSVACTAAGWKKLSAMRKRVPGRSRTIFGSWLQVGKLRVHFGDKASALDAVKLKTERIDRRISAACVEVNEIIDYPFLNLERIHLKTGEAPFVRRLSS